jgi:hypothetical protein
LTTDLIALDGRLYQLEERGGKKVVAEERLDGSLHMISKGMALKYREITERPKKVVGLPKSDLRMYTRPPKPSKDHPWRKRWQTRHPAPQQGISTY